MPAKCKRCSSANAEVFISYSRLSLCSSCFIKFYISRLKKTVKEFNMFNENDVVGVAVSGGKDSMALLYALKQAYPQLKVKALHINLGIPEYSAHCQTKVETLTKSLDVDLHIFDLKSQLGFSVDDFKKTAHGNKICSVCGTIKRHVFEELAYKHGVNVLATGHNMNDILDFMFKNFLYGRWDQLVRLKPVLPPLAKAMPRKVKPLLRSPENENLLYCLYNEIPFREKNCPFSMETEGRKYRKALEAMVQHNPHFLHQLLNRFLEIIPLLEKEFPKPALTRCKQCGFPSSSEICAYCRRISLFKK
ncbi:MAG: ATP-binding protein [Candidatus Bathyarchaeia archaeon]